SPRRRQWRSKTNNLTRNRPALRPLARKNWMTANPTPVRGEVWRIRFDPAEGDEIKKVRMAVVINENAVGRLRLKIVVPITEWKQRYASYPWFIHLAPSPTNGLTKDRKSVV